MAEIKLAQTYKFLVEKRQRERKREQGVKIHHSTRYEGMWEEHCPLILNLGVNGDNWSASRSGHSTLRGKAEWVLQLFDGVKRNQPVHNRIPSETIL